MATVKEMMMQDAPASIETAYMMSAGDTFEGNLSTKFDEDWIAIEMTAGMLYTINLSGRETDTDDTTTTAVEDTFLKLYDSKGGFIKQNDDVEGEKGNLNSSTQFAPEVSGTYYISAGAYTGNPELDTDGAYSVTVTAVELDPTLGAAIEGTEMADKLRGTDKSEKIVGMGGDDSLFGFGGDDTLDGGAGNDLLVGGMGKDTLMGGAGDDTISYNVSPAGVTINLTDGTARGGDADGDTIVDNVAGGRIENVIGSAHADELTGNRYDNKLWGLGGNDELDGLRGEDELYGGAGDDMLDGGRNDDTLEGGAGEDVLTGGDGDDTASYASSMMGVTVRLHNSRFMGGDAYGDSFGGTVTVEYTVADEDGDETDHEATLPDIANLTGSGMADVLAGDMRDNTIMGGGGDDMIYGGPSPKGATGDGDDSNDDMLHGQGGNDMIFGGAGDDTLDGGAGNDTLVGGGGDDTYYGGAGSDMIHADAADATINGWLETPPVDDTATADVDESTEAANDPMAVDTVSYARVENETETGVGTTGSPLTLGGTVITNVENIIGTQYDDFLTGDAGNNVIEGGAGRDTLVGGDGMDTLSYASSDSWVRVTLTDAAATVSRGHARGDNATGFENVMGSAYDDELTGNGAANVLTGGAGDDELDGMGGNDTLEGGAGADELDGGYTFTTAGDMNSEANTLSYASSDAGVTVNLASASVSGGHAQDDTIVTYEESAPTRDDAGNEIDVATFRNVTGSMHNDRLTGDHTDNELKGGAGDDTLRGGASQRDAGDSALALRGDVLVGGPGADVLDGGEDRGEGDDNMVNVRKDGIDNDDDGTIDEDDELDGTAEMVAASVDWAVYKAAMEGVTVNLATNMGTGGEAMGDTLRNIELVWGSEKADTFIAGPGPDIIEGDGGSDTVSYEASELGVTVDLSNTVDTTAGHRIVAVGGTGTETDPFTFGADATPATLTTAFADATAGVQSIPESRVADSTNTDPASDDNPETNGAAGDKFGSIENITGTAQKDTITGDANPNVLKGMGGGDTLSGLASNDTLDGGGGDDTLDGGAGADMLMGGAGDDTLNGGTEDDTLNGGGGDDDLSGGAGTNTFVFSPMDGGGDSDAILDWDTGTNNRIDLSAFELTPEQVIGAIELRGTGDNAYTVINLTEFGGGRITINDITSLDELDEATDTGPPDLTSDGVIQELNEYDATDNADGVFIL